jgi:hypothetical protein
VRSNVAPVAATGATEFVLPIWLPDPVFAAGPVFVAGPGLVPVPGPVPVLGSVGDADGLPEPESDGDGDVDTVGDGDCDCDGLDDWGGDEDVAGWAGGVEPGGVLGGAGCDADCEGVAVGEPLGVGQVTEVVTGG